MQIVRHFCEIGLPISMLVCALACSFDKIRDTRREMSSWDSSNWWIWRVYTDVSLWQHLESSRQKKNANWKNPSLKLGKGEIHRNLHTLCVSAYTVCMTYIQMCSHMDSICTKIGDGTYDKTSAWNTSTNVRISRLFKDNMLICTNHLALTIVSLRLFHEQFIRFYHSAPIL